MSHFQSISECNTGWLGDVGVLAGWKVNEQLKSISECATGRLDDVLVLAGELTTKGLRVG